MGCGKMFSTLSAMTATPTEEKLLKCHSHQLRALSTVSMGCTRFPLRAYQRSQIFDALTITLTALLLSACLVKLTGYKASTRYVAS